MTLWTAAHQASLSFSNSWSLLKLMSIESMIPSNHLILGRPLLLLPPVFPSSRVFFFSIESAFCIRQPKYWRFSISPYNEYSGLISFRIDWFDLLAVQGTLKSLPQHHNSKASVLFPVVQSLSCVLLFATPWTAACQASLFITNSLSLLKLMSIELGKSVNK